MEEFPWLLVLAYALFRVFEYYSLKNYQEMYQERQMFGPGMHRGPLSVMGAVLLPARIAGWGILIWVAMKLGLLPTLVVVVVAFLLSLVLQVTLAPVLWSTIGPVGFLAAVPIMVGVIALILATM
jgi:hypothetical protein